MATSTQANVPTGTTQSATYNSLPDWYTQYGQALTGSGLNILGGLNNYNGYVDAQGNPMPRVAGLTGQQDQASQLAGQQVGNWQGNLGAANNTTNQAIGQVNNQVGTLGQMTSGLGQAQGMLQPATNMLNPAQSYVQNGAQSYTAGANQPYMNQYTGDVVNQIATLGNRNLQENVLPQINSTFTGAGQFGSTRDADFNLRAMRDNQQAISNAQAQALMGAENNSMQLWQNDQNRSLQAGQLQGQLAGVQGGLASIQGNLASGYGNAAQVGNQIGTTLGNLGQSQASLGQTGQQLGINDINTLLTTGGLQQNTNQAGLNASYQDFLDRRDYPVNTLGALSQVLPNASGKITPSTQSASVSQGPTADGMTNFSNLLNLINAASGST